MTYGVQKIVAINSGNYIIAEVDVSKPVHLAAANNRGKSTLVNTLQFLYVDDFNKMRFGKRSLDDTRRHYFSSDKSYLVFECQTPAGVQCMLVHGRSNFNGGRFDRYVYGGAFQQTDYVEDARQIRDFQAVRAQLADRELTRVKSAELWRVLSANAPIGEGKTIPRLNILPIRKREEYEAFRDVFARLLSLSAANARTLKHLIIDSHARDLAERRIDVALDYREDFERVERSERELKLIQSVTSEIEEGRECRSDAQAIRELFRSSAPDASLELRKCYSYIEIEDERLNAQLAELESERSTLDAQKQLAAQALGSLEESHRQIQSELDLLAAAHAKWSQYPAQFIAELRRTERQKTAAVVELEQCLDQIARFDLHVMKSRAKELEARITSDQLAFSNWEKTAAAELMRAGVSESELQSAFRVVRPELLKLVVGKSLTIINREKLRDRIQAIAKRVKSGKYSDDVATADLSSVAPPDSSTWRDRKGLQKQLAIDEEDLRQQKARLSAAEDQERAQKRLLELRTECEEVRRDLNEFDNYVAKWATRKEIEDRRRASDKEIKRTQRDIVALSDKATAKLEVARQLNATSRALETGKRSLSSAAHRFHDHLRRVHLEMLPGEEVHAGKPPKALAAHIEALVEKLQRLTSDADRKDELEREILRLQDVIRDKSMELQADVCYFGDPESEWARLIESQELLPQREAANEKNWDALLKTLGARINGIVSAMRNIKLAIEGINRGLKTYRVSNLLAVEITVDVVHDIFSALETLTGSDGLFQDRDAIADAKKRLRRMIDTGQVIELPALFELRIRTQLADGTWKQAASLDEVGSTGTGMTTKAMIFIQLVRAIAANERYRLHFYIDGLGELDDSNLSATAAMAISKGIIPITADPRLHFEPLAHPEVTIYTLGQDPLGRFFIDSYRTYHARRTDAALAHSELTDE